MFDFIKNLNESKLIKGQEGFGKFSAREIADIIFLCLLTLQILKQENPDFIKEYSSKTLKYDDVDNFRLSSSDLYIMLFVLFGENNKSSVNFLKHQEDSLTLLTTLRFSYLNLKDWLSDEIIDAATFILSSEFNLNIRNKFLKSIRRDISEWHNLKDNLKDQTIKDLIRQFSNYNADMCDLCIKLSSNEIVEMASAGAVSAGSIAAVPQPLFTQPFSRLPTKSIKKNKKLSKKDK